MQIGEHSESLSRADAIRKGALAVGAVLGLGAVGPYVRRALAFAGDNDADTLNLLLMFEYMEVEFFEESRTRLKASPELRKLIEELGGQEDGHVEALTEQIKKVGGKPLPQDHNYAVFSYRPRYEEVYLQTGWELENIVIGAYNGAIPLLKSKEAQRLAASIAQVEGRHAAALRLQDEEEPAPEAFDLVYTEYQALRSVVRWAGPINSPSN